MREDGSRKRRHAVWGAVLLVAYTGLAATDVVMNRPRLFAADPATGRVCRAPTLARHPPQFFYYTTATGCTVAWTFAALGGIAVLALFS